MCARAPKARSSEAAGRPGRRACHSGHSRQPGANPGCGRQRLTGREEPGRNEHDDPQSKRLMTSPASACRHHPAGIDGHVFDRTDPERLLAVSPSSVPTKRIKPMFSSRCASPPCGSIEHFRYEAAFSLPAAREDGIR